jgi:hypothetical protein
MHIPVHAAARIDRRPIGPFQNRSILNHAQCGNAATAGRHLAFALSCICAAVVLPDGAVGSGRDAPRSSVESRD